MENFQNDDLQYVVDDYYDVNDFEHDDSFAEPELQRDAADFDSDFEDDFESVRLFFFSKKESFMIMLDPHYLDSRICNFLLLFFHF